MSTPSNSTLARRRTIEPGDDAAREWTCRSRSRPRGPASRPSGSSGRRRRRRGRPRCWRRRRVGAGPGSAPDDRARRPRAGAREPGRSAPTGPRSAPTRPRSALRSALRSAPRCPGSLGRALDAVLVPARGLMGCELGRQRGRLVARIGRRRTAQRGANEQPGRRADEVGRLAGDALEHARRDPVDSRHAAQEAQGVRVARFGEQLVALARPRPSGRRTSRRPDRRCRRRCRGCG